MSNVTFITGNQNKADYLARLLGMEIDHQKIELNEIQSTDLGEIVTDKAQKAYEILGRPVLVEDVALAFDALNGLPGPFIKYFVEQPDGTEKLCRMLDGFENRSARAMCSFAYFDGKHLELFSGELAGTISESPWGENGWDWDMIFCPEGYGGRTRAELSSEEDDETYQLIKPFSQIKAFLEKLT